MERLQHKRAHNYCERWAAIHTCHENKGCCMVCMCVSLLLMYLCVYVCVFIGEGKSWTHWHGLAAVERTDCRLSLRMCGELDEGAT